MPAHKRQFCAQGHDTWAVGRTPGRQCRQCKRDESRKKNRLPERREYNAALLRKRISEGYVRPSNDPNSTKYPERKYYQGSWCTQGQIERARVLHLQWEKTRAQNRVLVGMCGYCGKNPLATQDGYGCNQCLDKKISPKELLKARRREALKSRAERKGNQTKENTNG